MTPKPQEDKPFYSGEIKKKRRKCICGTMGGRPACPIHRISPEKETLKPQESNDFLQTGAYHCFGCHKDFQSNDHALVCKEQLTPFGCEKCDPRRNKDLGIFPEPQEDKPLSGEKLKCPYCGKDAEWLDNKEVYGRRFGKSYMCWYCRGCDAYVGCHQNSKRPLGTMANKALRLKRIETHNLLDSLWQSGRFTRRFVYRILEDAFGRKIHVGESDEKTCEEIIATLRKLI